MVIWRWTGEDKYNNLKWSSNPREDISDRFTRGVYTRGVDFTFSF